MKLNTYSKFNDEHYVAVLRAKSARRDAEGAEATRYKPRTLSALLGQINERFMALFKEAV